MGAAFPFPLDLTHPVTGVRVSLAAAATEAALIGANPARFGVVIWNEGSTVLYLALGETAASLTDYTVQVVPGGYYETPYHYAGPIRGLWAGGPSGFARLTEIL